MFGLINRRAEPRKRPRLEPPPLYHVSLSGGPLDGHSLVSADRPSLRLQLPAPSPEFAPALNGAAIPRQLIYEMVCSIRPLGQPIVKYYYDFRGYASTANSPAAGKQAAWWQRLWTSFVVPVRCRLTGWLAVRSIAKNGTDAAG